MANIQKGDYVAPLHLNRQHDIGIVDRVRRVRSTQSRDLVVSWLTHTGSSYEFSSSVVRLDPKDPRVVAYGGGAIDG